MDCSIFFGDNGSLGGFSTIKEINPQKKSLLALGLKKENAKESNEKRPFVFPAFFEKS